MDEDDKHLYDEDGNYKSRISSRAPLAVEARNAFVAWGLFLSPVLLILLFGGLAWILSAAINYQGLTVPYRWVAIFYVLVIFAPIKAGVSLHAWVFSKEFTPFPNLNLMIGIFTDTLYILVCAVALYWLFAKSNVRRKTATIILLAPAMLALFWFLLASVFGWIFTRS